MPLRRMVEHKFWAALARGIERFAAFHGAERVEVGPGAEDLAEMLAGADAAGGAPPV